ncbi:MAG: Holliday junction resolvasome RuvABC endonuclease subunit RuvC [Candidatus Alkanophagales archaeon MCA70_species_1]|nr:Holliday junction resolvasome RuvABC endonuclease subunit RuvC [Candidatus Alkanophaga volatiphilum]
MKYHHIKLKGSKINLVKVIGIDPGTATTGWGVVSLEGRRRGHKLRCVACGAVRTSPRKKAAERLKRIYDELSLIIERTKPQEMALEKLFFNINVKTAVSVTRAAAACMLAAAAHDMPVFEYNPSHVKWTLVRYGRATKIEVANRVKELLRLEETPKPDDVTDALAVAICHILLRTNSDGGRKR